MFVDETGANSKTARVLGWQTFKYDDTTQVLHASAAVRPPRARGPGEQTP